MRQGGKQALQEGRHGHPAKLRGEVREWLEETCRQAPYTPSHEIQAQLAERLPSPSASVNSIGFESLGRQQSTPICEKKVSRPPREQEGAGALSALGRLSGRPQPYSYRHVERFLRILAIANADKAFTATLARRTSALWQVKARSQEATSPHVYVEGHRKLFTPRPCGS